MRRRASVLPLILATALLLAPGSSAADDPAPTQQPKAEPATTTRAQVDAEAKLTYRKLSADVREKLDQAVELLSADAKAITNVNSEKPPHFERPHSAVAELGPEMALPAAIRMRDKLTDERYRDTFIRWHLMWVVRQVPEADRKQVLALLAQLTDRLPGDLKLERKALFRHEPASAYGKWAVLYGQVRLVVGYPPFQTYVNPPESLQRMTPKRRAEAEKIWKRCQKLESSFKTIADGEAPEHNRRANRMTHVARQYQGELIGHLVRSGDPQMLKKVMRLIDKHARKESIIGFDLLTYLYLAAFDGALEQYDQQVLREAGAQLARTAKATKGDWVEFGHSKRNFSEYAFHMVRLLNAGDTSELHAAEQ